ncbi:MAG: hypothetical protein ABH885_04900 [Candidatus Omnitrophota bacterium]
MKKVVLLICSACLVAAASRSFAEDHIRELDAVRTAIIEQGNNMPDLIRDAKDTDIRTLERIYELSTSLLTTVEAYFKMLRLVIASKIDINNDVISSLNEWLAFIHNQCGYDIEYLNEALGETQSEEIKKQIEIARNNVQRLASASMAGMEENADLAPED